MSVKGGMWKNTEDEILKAAVMKYGKNQWSRISSLLVRKSAKQCKQRWYEWLDPSIRKVAWTREEEERLLHLAKIMPTQWRTIASRIDGRTATQCLQQYEVLLDRAQGRDELSMRADDPRRLNPGEADPNPETKPALPDPIDMDEDERDMLQEARARLANTKGKKAKRKDREKKLDEARRIAQVRQRRELKAAGIYTKVKVKRKRLGRGELDLAKETPFFKPAPRGFYDTSDEKARLARDRRDPMSNKRLLSEMEEKRRDVEEARERKKDQEKMKRLKRDNLPAALQKINKMNDPSAFVARPSLNLPAPQVTNDELELIAKAGTVAAAAAARDEGAADGPTASLLAQVQETPKFTPMRTPLMRDGGGDSVNQEAQNLVALVQGQTPLLGGDNPVLHRSDFAGALPTPKHIQTPHALKTGSATPSATVKNKLRTPITHGGSAAASADAAHAQPFEEDEEMGARPMALEPLSIGAALSSLPAPKNEYEIEVAKVPQASDAPESDALVPDAADDLEANAALKRAEKARQHRLRSQVINRKLPRPLEAPALVGEDDVIAKELALLITYDNVAHPIDRKKKKKRKRVTGTPIEIDMFTEEQMERAARMIQEEMGADLVDSERFSAAWDAHNNQMVFVPEEGWVHREAASDAQLVAAYKAEFQELKKALTNTAKKTRKLAGQLQKQFEPHKKTSHSLQVFVGTLADKLLEEKIRVSNFTTLKEREARDAPVRIGNLKSELAKAQEYEQNLQRQYLELRRPQ